MPHIAFDHSGLHAAARLNHDQMLNPMHPRQAQMTGRSAKEIQTTKSTEHGQGMKILMKFQETEVL